MIVVSGCYCCWQKEKEKKKRNRYGWLCATVDERVSWNLDQIVRKNKKLETQHSRDQHFVERILA